MNNFDPHAYGPVLGPLVDTDRRRPLNSGRPDPAPCAVLDNLSVERAFADAQSEFGPTQPVDPNMASCCLAAVWLLHDFLDQSHSISQHIESPSGSCWHGIMHRREGDFSNAKYWFHHTGRHPVFDPLGQRAGELAATHGESTTASRVTHRGDWDPIAFVELCESVHRGGRPEVRELCLDLQQAEWEMLFDYCYRAAIGHTVAA